MPRVPPGRGDGLGDRVLRGGQPQARAHVPVQRPGPGGLGSTVLDLLTGRLQLTLTPAGVLPFKGKTALVYPYHMMSPAQKELLRGLLEDRSAFVVCSDSVVFHRREGDPERLDPVPVLLAMCQGVLATRIHEDHKVRVGICNILLQRVQSAVPISRGAQQELNSLLFGK